MALEQVVQCPVCHGNELVDHLICKDHTATHEEFHVKHCLACGLGITTPRPDFPSSHRYYQSDQYISHTSKSKGLLDTIYLIIRRFTISWKYQWIKPYLKSSGVLDYGCGTGTFLEKVASHKHPVMGVEPSDEARRMVPATCSVVSALDQMNPQAKFDVITLWHVLEHIYLLEQTLQQLASRLTDGGVMFLAVPNHSSFDAEYYRNYWAAYDVPRHIWHFTPSSMATFLQHQGLRLIETLPMKMDAYYVSLLSERYKATGLPGVIRALWVALRSNWKARTGANYSSLIFVVTRK